MQLGLNHIEISLCIPHLNNVLHAKFFESPQIDVGEHLLQASVKSSTHAASRSNCTDQGYKFKQNIIMYNFKLIVVHKHSKNEGHGILKYSARQNTCESRYQQSLQKWQALALSFKINDG